MKLSSLNTILFWSAIVSCIVAFTWKNHIIFTDEVLFEEASYQMLTTHDYLTPQLEGNIWLEKPPLYFWFTNIAYKIFGIAPFTTRLGVVLAAIGSTILTFKLSKSIFNEKAAFWATTILTTAPLFLAFTKTANLDIPTTFFILLTLHTYLKAKTNKKWIIISATSLGLGFLTRSFLALTPLGVIVIDQLFLTKSKLKWQTLLLGLSIFLLIALPWNLLMLNLHPNQYLQNHLSFNLSLHLLSQTPGHDPLSAANFLAKILFRFNPLAPFALYGIIKKRKKITSPTILLYAWILIAIIPLTISATRNVWYAIQILPPISILAGQGINEARKNLKKRFQNPYRWEMVNILVSALLLSLPTAVFVSTFQQANVIEVFDEFLSITPSNTPLYNLEYSYTPNSTHYNPRLTLVITANQITSIKKPAYLYLDGKDQWHRLQEATNDCCTLETLIERKESKVVRIDSKQNE